ncbi:MAG TPA: hypothetical protein DCE41_27380 [Cytophagales bacterium]|nr:hypothetical protein [Cytophagales bacterium]HAA22650.1 hypothetical protein [Cytophagales bacterium]
MEAPNKRYRITTFVGLFIVLVLTTLFWFPSVYKAILSGDFEVRNYQMQGVDWLVVLIILGLIRWGERNPLSTLNIKKPTGTLIATGMGLGGFSMLYIFLHRLVLNGLGVTTGFEQQTENPALEAVGPEFVWVYGIFSLITASVAEEIMYRGYATERLMKVSGSYWAAFIVPLLAFVLMHYRKGFDHLLVVLVVGSLMQFYYLKFRNLTINIVGHFFIDLMAYVGILSKEL